MVVLRWLAVALALALVPAIPVAQAGYPECRTVTEGIPSEYYNNRYVYVDEDHIEEWREFNGYTGLQRQKCVTETGLVVGRDTLLYVIYYDRPTEPEGPGDPTGDLPDPSDPEIPEVPTQPPWTICGRDPGTPIPQILSSCIQGLGDPPDGPEWDPPNGVCGAPATTPLTGQLFYCIPPIYTDPGAVIAYIDWLQFVLDATLDLVLYVLSSL